MRRSRLSFAVGLLMGVLVAASPSSGQTPAAPQVGRWTSLFNGKDLEGWIPKFAKSPLGENYRDTFRVDDGVLKVTYEKWDKFDGEFGHLFFYQPFSKYRLRVEYRFVGDQCPGGPGWAVRNSGAMLYCQDPTTMTKDQDFPSSLEIQFLGGGERGERPTANVCSPGTVYAMGGKLITQHCTDSKSKTFRGDQWVTVEVECHGFGPIKNYVNGELVMEYEKPQLDANDPQSARLIKDGRKDLAGGWIALQAESHPVEFRKVEIMLLDE
ncbi:3-keto-disaccharide hydrolase [Paludisphaera mucosa]|uniref:DUF1080 domain-containing protein n=1 Tax=Paludisphaera mucosa TaxID=3030827 RepID=A0ABT6F823_9BACT|nr:DUF1080 domain-containing protein [Paludisphaera mucosa]MDG3003729.1 DUF1080 domain-containing protein [Paludisphaera mucosa]